jgi:type IV pilus assembly protein PilQ
MARAISAALAVTLSTGVAGAESGGSNQIRAVDVSQNGEKTVIRVVGSHRPTYTAFKLSSPKRLVVDLADSRVRGVPSIVNASTSLIDGVAVSQFSTGGVPVSRIMVNFRREAAYRVRARGEDLLITLTGGGGTDEVTSGDAAESSEKRARAENRAEIEKLRAEAERKVAEARAEAERKVAAARAEAERAQARLEEARVEMNDLREKSEARVESAERARRETRLARIALEKARAELESVSSNKDSKADRIKRKAEKRIAELKVEARRAERKAERESGKREILEKRLAGLEADLEAARKAAGVAAAQRERAEEEKKKLEEKLRRKAREARLAEAGAEEALAAQQRALRAYREAAEGEKAELLAVLEKRRKETIEAKARLVELQEAQKKTGSELGAAERRFAKAEGEAERAAKTRDRVVAKTAKELARARQERDEALAEAERARKRMEAASEAKRLAEAEIAKARREAAAAENRAERKAERRVEQAEKRLARTQKARDEAEQRSKRIERQLVEAKEVMKKARQRAERYEGELASMRREAEQVERKLASTEKKLARTQRERDEALAESKKAEKRVEAAHEAKRLAEAKADEVERRAEAKVGEAEHRAKQRIARLESLAKKAAAERKDDPPLEKSPEDLTQEELRLQRLAEWSGRSRPDGESGGDASEEPAEPEENAAAAIKAVEFFERDGAQEIVVRSDRDLEYTKTTGADGKAVLVFDRARLGPMLERTLDVTDFGGVVERVSSYERDGGVRIEVELAERAGNRVSRDSGEIAWVFEPRAKKRNERGSGAESRTVAREDASAYAYPDERTAAYAVQLKRYGEQKKRYTGRRIDLDFKDADIHNILRLLSDVGHVNIVTADDVSGTVTIRMRNVPWDQALDVILQAKRLGMVRRGNLIRVATLATLEKEREMEIARRKQNQTLKPLETRLIPVSYASAKEIMPRTVDLLSERGKISVDDRTNVLIARDVVETLDQIESLVRNLDTQTPQVLIEGRIVEATSTYAREIGIQWGGDFAASTATGNPTGLGFPSTVGVAGGGTDSQTPVGGMSPVAGGRPNPNFAVNLPAATGTNAGGALGITLGSISNNANLNLRLSALEEEGTLRILSSPKILTLDNREAHIEQGTLIPYSRISAQGIQTSFKEAKLNLTVTPHVTADGSVLMNLKMTRDEPDFNNKGARGDPTILKREAETELLVNDGHTAVIGGIFTRNHGTSYKKVPFFGDIPVIGWLFKKRSDSDRRSEMLIFITPRIVNRAESIGQ